MKRQTLAGRLTSSGFALVVVLAVLMTVTTASAAGATTVRLAAEDPITVSETSTVDVVVDDVDSGVGAYHFTATIDDPGTAKIVDVELRGDPSEQTSSVEVASDRSSVTVIAALANTADTGSISIATIEVRAERIGSTDLDLTVSALGDEQGNSYTTTSQGTELTAVESTESGDDDGSARTAGGDQPAETPDEAAADEDDVNQDGAEEAAADEDDVNQDGADEAAADGTTADEGAAVSTENPTASAETEATARTDMPASETSSSVPGFGVIAALFALVAVVLALRRSG